LEELVVSTANSKTTKEQIASFFKECYTGPELSEDMTKPALDVEKES
jgi:hypothetical protein